MPELDFLTEEAKELAGQVIDWRRDLHKIPELGFELHQTSAYIRQQLDRIGIRFQRAAQTGIVALIEGGTDGPTLALRADMDALPIKEETGLSYASSNGNMHACGHDAHAAMLIAAAEILHKHRHKLKGQVKLLFQPGEEGYGGAEAMIKDGCLENPAVDAIYGLHVGQIFPEVGLGQVGVCPGPIMAAATKFRVVVKGQGTHGALPHQGVDSIVIAAEMILALQKIVSRETDPLNPKVLTVGKIAGGEAINIVTPRVEFSGDFRTLRVEDREFVTRRLKEICTATATAARAEAEVEVFGGYPPTINDPCFAAKVADAAVSVIGRKNLINITRPNMGTEDMSYYLKKVPGAYFALGTGNPAEGITYPHHNPKFNVDENVLWIGPALFARLAFDYLA